MFPGHSVKLLQLFRLVNNNLPPSLYMYIEPAGASHWWLWCSHGFMGGDSRKGVDLDIGWLFGSVSKSYEKQLFALTESRALSVAVKPKHDRLLTPKSLTLRVLAASAHLQRKSWKFWLAARVLSVDVMVKDSVFLQPIPSYFWLPKNKRKQIENKRLAEGILVNYDTLTG